jgi:hypothetical protein
MSFIRREWTPEAADRWSKEDWIAAAFSVAAYLLFILGGVLSLLGVIGGFLLLAASVLATWAMHYVIDPKLRAVSTDYEKKQMEYIERMEQLTRWGKHQ